MVSFEDKNINKCLETQIEEIEVLCSIYGDEWKIENEVDRSYSIEIKQGNRSVILYVTLPRTYPFESPPTYSIQSPGMSREQKNQLSNHLEEVYLENVGQTVLFQWIEKIKEYLMTLETELHIDNQDVCENEGNKVEFSGAIPEIIHGEQIVDRKSIFQGHASVVLSVNEVREALKELKKDRKIAKATHNIYAYRIINSNNCFNQDCDDDGESKAGGRLLHLLQVLNVTNVLVVVTRWYGGCHLGPDRFRHINNAAKNVLELAGLINSNKKI